MQIGTIGIGVQAAWIALACFNFAAAANPKVPNSEERTVYGRIVDDQGNPVAGASVCWYWRANGSGRDAKRQVLDVSTRENLKEYWGRLGQMEVAGAEEVKSAENGKFSINVPGAFHALMAIDESRRRGGIAILSIGDDEREIEIRLEPLVKVKGRFAAPEPANKLEWTHVYVMLPEDRMRPLDTTRLAGCGSFEARFEASLPPGRYRLYGYNDSQDAHLAPEKEIVLKPGMRELDLGTLTLSPYLSMQARVARSKASGRWTDFKGHYGESPPRWHAVDARGVSKDVSIEAFEGKWVLLDFWGPSCRACMKSGMPRLISFYERHGGQRDQFEILSICIDFEGDIKSMADLDRTLAPVIEHAWGGKSIPFLILLDSTFKTWERYGLPGLGTVLLIDPDGKLVPGDETELAKQLK